MSATFIALYILAPSRQTERITVSNQDLRVRETPSQQEVEISSPVLLAIPKIAIDAIVHPVGLDAVGDMDIDQDGGL